MKLYIDIACVLFNFSVLSLYVIFALDYSSAKLRITTYSHKLFAMENLIALGIKQLHQLMHLCMPPFNYYQTRSNGLSRG